MAERKRKARQPSPRRVRKTVTLDADKLERARAILGVTDDAEVIRRALDHLLARFAPSNDEEE
jgi:hypothetical protein